MKINFSKNKPTDDGYYLVLFSSGEMELVKVKKIKDNFGEYFADVRGRARNIENYKCFWSEQITGSL